jgi:3-methyl-2-oxobutanoate hydroxymethyltransferase
MSTSWAKSKIGRFFDMKRQADPISVLTAYDAPTARAEEDAGIDLILVGDSVGTNVLGYASEREVTLDDIAHHVRAVRRGAPDTPVLADLPYATYDTPKAAVSSARRLVTSGADMVKLEGFYPEIVAALVAADIPVCGHLGLECQHHDEKRLKARTAAAALELETHAIALAQAGLSLLVLELIPEPVATRITRRLDIPTIGIGAGRGTDGQVLVITDVLGVTKVGFRHNRRFAELGTATRDAALAYVQAVRTRQFPAKDNVFAMPKTELALSEDET